MKPHTNSAPTAVDLFCGAGGLSAGLTRAGFTILGALDSWQQAVQTYRLNFNHSVVHADIRQLSGDDFLSAIQAARGDIDLVAGGPPCQGFSIQRIGADADQRNSLIFEFARIVLDLQPRMFLMENVPGILGSRGRTDASKFQEILISNGYDVRVQIVNAAQYGVPQTRRRVFFYGWRLGFVRPFVFPLPSGSPDECPTVWQAIGDLPSPAHNHSPIPSDPLHRRMRLSPKNVERLRLIPPGGGFENLPADLRVDCHKAGAERIGHRYVYGRLDPDRPAGTVTARFDSFTRGKFGHPFEDRNISLREGARLQTFEDEFRFSGTQEDIAALIGNAVPPKIAEIIGRALCRHLGVAHEEHGAADMNHRARAALQLRLFNPVV